MAYEVTAAKKRPQTFDELAGQNFVVSTLMNSIDSDRIAHAYLFSGPRGVGKTSAARILAKALNCEDGPTSHPCGECSNCWEITTGNALDVIEIDGASNTSVNDVREIKNEVLFAPNSSRYKVYIIDEVHMLSNSAFNALLKTIEEPPPYVIFIFATTEIHKVPATIRSRCQQFHFQLIPLDVIKNKLTEAAEEDRFTIDDQALFWIAKEAAGSLRDAYTLLDQIASFSENEITMGKIQEKMGLIGADRISMLAEQFISHDTARALQLTDEILSQGVSAEQFIVDLAEYFRSILFLRQGITAETLLGNSADHFSDRSVRAFSSEQLETIMDMLLKLYRDLRYSINQRYELELLIQRLCSLNMLVSPTVLVGRIEQLQETLETQQAKIPAPGSNTERKPGGNTKPNALSNSEAERSMQHAQSTPQHQHQQQKLQPQSLVSAFRNHIRDSSAEHSAGASAAKPVTRRDSRQQGNRQEHDQLAASQDPAQDPAEHEEPENLQKPDPSVLQHPEEHAAEGDSSAAEFSQDGFDAIVAFLTKQRPALASTLEQVVRWDHDSDNLRLYFASSYPAHAIQRDAQYIESVLSSHYGKSIKLHVDIENTSEELHGKAIQSDETIEMLTQLFRGEVIDGGKRNERYESNGHAEESE